MRNNLVKFRKASDYYTKLFKRKFAGKNFFIILDINDEKAFFSLAPLSRALHNLGSDIQIAVIDGKNKGIEILMEIWDAYDELKKRVPTKKAIALGSFIDAVNKRTKTKIFNEIFERPEIVLRSDMTRFTGIIDAPYFNSWRNKYRWEALVQTATKIWSQGYDLSKNDIVNIGFVTVPSEKNTELPLNDYLDSFSISYAMAMSSKRAGAKTSLWSNSDRFSILARPVRTADLMITIKGCELSKNIDEGIFKKFKLLSQLLKIDRLENSTAGFSIHGRGYFGRHFFGENIGYPTPNRKSRWSSPGQILLKDRFSPQTRYETRDPKMRYAITETLPIDIFIETCNVDYNRIRKRSETIRDIFNRCRFIKVIGKNKAGYKTDFKVELIRNDGWRRMFTAADSNVRTIVDQEEYKKSGQKTGSFANFPSGETFCTPESVTGIVVGDVVINIDRSHVIPKNSPIVIEMKNGRYKILKAPRDILSIVKKEKKEVRQKIKDYEKNRSLPKEIIETYKRNFNRVGEFAVNTNPKAKLCDYLIVNEKIARMFHIAYGSGFEPDTKTLYHWDMVINAPKQKVDLYGVDDEGKIEWVIKKGKFVV